MTFQDLQKISKSYLRPEQTRDEKLLDLSIIKQLYFYYYNWVDFILLTN
jgi:hypothetical protein